MITSNLSLVKMIEAICTKAVNKYDVIMDTGGWHVVNQGMEYYYTAMTQC